METLWWIANDSVLLLASIFLSTMFVQIVWLGAAASIAYKKNDAKKRITMKKYQSIGDQLQRPEITALVFASIRNEGGGGASMHSTFHTFCDTKSDCPIIIMHMQINTNAVIALSRKGNKGPASQIGCFGWSHEKRMNVIECSVAFAPIDLFLHWRCTLNKHTPSLHKVVKQTTTIAIAAYRLQVECFAYFGIVCLAKPAEATTKTTEHTLYVNRMKIAYGHSTICEHEMRRRSFGFILFHLLASVSVVVVVAFVAVLCFVHFISFVLFVCHFALYAFSPGFDCALHSFPIW